MINTQLLIIYSIIVTLYSTVFAVQLLLIRMNKLDFNTLEFLEFVRSLIVIMFAITLITQLLMK